MEAAAEKIEQLVNENAVMVFSKSHCPYCANTKRTLKDLGVPHQVIELDRESDGSAVQDGLEQRTGQRTVPNVFIGGQSIGGNSELQDAKKNGNLKARLAKANISYDTSRL